MAQIQLMLYKVTILMATVLFFYNFIILLLRGLTNKARRILSYTNFIWGLLYLYLVIIDLTDVAITNYPIFSTHTLVLSNFFICIMFFFPVEIVTPGWLNLKRVILIFIPSIFISTFYLTTLSVLDEDQEKFTTFGEMLASITHFNVWFRIVILISNLLYSFGFYRFIYLQLKNYNRWQDEHYSDRESMDITWITFYFKMMAVMIVAYLMIIFVGKQWCTIAYTILVVFNFAILFYKGLFQESPYPEDFYTQTLDIHQAEQLEAASINEQEKAEKGQPDDSFESKIPDYAQKIKKWLETERPYLYKEFKLNDLTRILPLNRTYISRIFNEGFHQNFSDVVRTYRIEYAKQVMTDHPDYTIYKVAEMSGFSSDSNFIKAFQKITGITPKKFKLKQIEEETA